MTTQDLPTLLRAWRAREGLTQAAAAREIGCALVTYQKWEQGVHCPAGYVLKLLVSRIAP